MRGAVGKTDNLWYTGCEVDGMIYLTHITLPSDKPAGWPFTIPAVAALTRLPFPAPVTLLAGDNGSGKSTLLEALAVRLKLPAVGRVDAGRDDTLAAVRPLARAMGTVFAARPRSRFFLRSEDFFNFVRNLSSEREQMREELRRVKAEYAGRSAFAENQAKMAYAGVIADMESRYGQDLLEAASHGESFLRLFEERIAPRGLYLMDEPEAPLSPLRQMALLALIRRMAVEEECQFIIATHSPILLAMPGAVVYDLDRTPPAPADWRELPGISLMRDFLERPESFLRHLEEP